MILSQTRQAPARRRLSELLPLSTPLTLMIDPANACNFRCSFCPTGDEDLLAAARRPMGVMDFDLYRRIIGGLKAFPQRVKSLRLYKDGEPFLNKRLPDMIRHAKERGVAEEVYVITNGSVLSEATAAAVVEAGLDRIRVSVEHVTAEGYKALTRTYSDYEAVLGNVRRLHRAREARKSPLHIDVKIVDAGLKAEELAKFQADFGPVSDSLTLEALMGWSDSSKKDWTLGTSPATGIDAQSALADVQVCPEPFKGLAVNFDGTVSVCCVDWSHGTVVGDLRKESLFEVWNGPRLKEFRLMHLRRERRRNPACADCHYVKGRPTWARLDGDADRLLKVYGADAARR